MLLFLFFPVPTLEIVPEIADQQGTSVLNLPEAVDLT